MNARLFSCPLLWSFIQILFSCTLVCRIDVHARLLILRKKSPLYGLILVCTFIDFEKKFPPARLFHPARLLVFVCLRFHSIFDPVQSCPNYSLALPNQSLNNPKQGQSIPNHSKDAMARNCSQKFPPALSYFGQHVYWFCEKIPPCTSILTCTFNVF